MPILTQNPGIFAAAALGGIDNQRSLAQCHTRQSAGNDRDFVAIEDVRAQVHVARFDAAVFEQAGRARKVQRGLRDVVARIRLDAPPEFFPIRGAALPAQS